MSSALELSPSPRSISLFKIRQIADAGPDSDNLDSLNLANDFKFHSSSVLSNKPHPSPPGWPWLPLVATCSQAISGKHANTMAQRRRVSGVLWSWLIGEFFFASLNRVVDVRREQGHKGLH